MHNLFIDLETYSGVPIGKAGLYKYAQSPDFAILLLCYSLNSASPVVIDLAQGERIPIEIHNLLFDPLCRKHAYNAAFEWYCLSQYFRLNNPGGWLPQWRDTMLHALYCGYPASLAAAGKALGLPEDKRKLAAGKALIKTFCVPRMPTVRDPRTRIRPTDEPEKWLLFKQYNAQDVISETEIEHRLSAWSVPAAVQAQWEQDQIINARGIALDLDLMRGALACDSAVTVPLAEEAQQLTGLDNPNSTAQIKPWLRDRGYQAQTLRKDDVTELLANGELDDTARRVLEIRQSLNKSSVKKYAAMDTAVCADGRIRGTMQFYGAPRTGRWAGRLLQVQNLPRTYLQGTALTNARDWVKGRNTEAIDTLIGQVPDVLSQLVRTALIPSPGLLFVDADYSAIEARVIAWLAGEQWVLDVFRSHGKIYEACASQMFGVPIARIAKGNPEYELRQKGKVATLALGYQGSTGALIQLGALRMGIPEDDLPDIVRRWRDTNRRIVDLWYALEAAAIDTVRTGRSNAVRGLIFTLEGDREKLFLTIQLPGGRKLFYAQPHLVKNDRGRDQLHYWGQNQTSRKWEAIDTYGGKLAENCVQAIARDCLAEAIQRLEDAGYPVVFTVHDEVVLEVPAEKADLDDVCRIMARPVPWAHDLPLKADGWIGRFYTKD